MDRREVDHNSLNTKPSEQEEKNSDLHEETQAWHPEYSNSSDGKTLNDFMDCYLHYLADVAQYIKLQNEKIDHLLNLMLNADKIHMYGFGRSGAAASSFAVRLRHFCDFLPGVWWVGDLVREPMQKGGLLILFSGSGSRPETICVANQARNKGLDIVLITMAKKSVIRDMADLVIEIPPIDTEVYGSGDYELASYFLQESIVAFIGKKAGIPPQAVDWWHV